MSLVQGWKMSHATAATSQPNALLNRLEELNAIGIALSSERDTNRLLENILIAAKRITHADAGTLYLLDPKQQALKSKTTTRKVLIYTCQKCKKSAIAKDSRRVSKIVFE